MPCQGILAALSQKVLLDRGNPPGLAVVGHTGAICIASSLNLPKTNKIPIQGHLLRFGIWTPPPRHTVYKAPSKEVWLDVFLGLWNHLRVSPFTYCHVCCYSVLFKLYLTHQKIGISRRFPSTKVSFLMTRFPWILGIAVKLIGNSWSNCHGHFFTLCLTLPKTNSMDCSGTRW